MGKVSLFADKPMLPWWRWWQLELPSVGATSSGHVMYYTAHKRYFVRENWFIFIFTSDLYNTYKLKIVCWGLKFVNYLFIWKYIASLVISWAHISSALPYLHITMHIHINSSVLLRRWNSVIFARSAGAWILKTICFSQTFGSKIYIRNICRNSKVAFLKLPVLKRLN